MMTSSEFVQFLKEKFPDIKIYNGTINRKEAYCIGVYTQGTYNPILAIGGPANTSYGVLPIRILVHWGEDANICQQKANEIYNILFGLNDFKIADRRIINLQMLDPCPVDIQRDENNICEMIIRLVIFYDKEV